MGSGSVYMSRLANNGPVTDLGLLSAFLKYIHPLVQVSNFIQLQQAGLAHQHGVDHHTVLVETLGHIGTMIWRQYVASSKL